MYSKSLEKLKAALVEDEKQQEIKKENENKKFWDSYGFKTWQEVIDYVMQGHTLYHYMGYLRFNKERNKIEFNTQCSNEFDTNFWQESTFYTPEEFIENRNNINKKFPNFAINKYGYIDMFDKYNSR